MKNFVRFCRREKPTGFSCGRKTACEFPWMYMDQDYLMDIIGSSNINTG